MTNHDIIIELPEKTVVSSFESKRQRETFYESEEALEKKFIELLKNQSYEYINIKNEEELIINLRHKIEKLNNIKFTDNEWKYILEKEIGNNNLSIEEKTKKIQEDPRFTITLDNGNLKNIMILNKENIHENCLQVINQFENDQGNRKNRYDVTILVNGLPLIHIELKRRGIHIKEAFNQIRRYENESFWSGHGLFEYIQIYIISNGRHTKYYSNTTRKNYIKNQEKSTQKIKSQNNYESTSWWTDEQNNQITDLLDFGSTFLSRHTILNILTNYCIFTVKQDLMIMRPYQIVAVEKIVNKIKTSYNHKKYGTIESGGYIWHTTGSGKTLTSFKATKIVSELTNTKRDKLIKKVFFIVDRKDLDNQTIDEYKKFSKDSVNGNKDTKALTRQIEDNSINAIITTIQKMSIFISKNKNHEIFKEHCVFIFDECHRSQFGEMNISITKNFKNYYLFGFTGTPIFPENAFSGKTTEQIFGEKLHTYTIVNAIEDKNVLPFKVEIHETFKEKENIEEEKIKNIDKEKIYENKTRISNITKYILDNFNKKTKRDKNTQKNKGFNSIFAVSSIEMAINFYKEFENQQKEKPENEKLKIATIFSFNPNGEQINDNELNEENSDNTEGLKKTERDFLEDAIRDYNKMFTKNWSTDSENFQDYYKDVSEKMKNCEIDILIVVNMFLTGFDAPGLNTLWVDKNLRFHGLIQSFSRTNRILDSIKTFGIIVCFRDLNDNIDEAISLFGNKDAKGIILLKPFKEYYANYIKEVEELKTRFPVEKEISGEQNEKDFINLFGKILKSINILSSFDEFEGKETLNDRDMQDYKSIYIDKHENTKKIEKSEKTDVSDDIVFEMELIKQFEINIDYILFLIKKLNIKNKENEKTPDHVYKEKILDDIYKAIDSTTELRSKKTLIDEFIKTQPKKDVDEEWKEFVTDKKEAELKEIIEDEKLIENKTKEFMQTAFEKGELQQEGSEFTQIMKRSGSRFSKETNNETTRSKKKNKVFTRLIEFFNKYFNI